MAEDYQGGSGTERVGRRPSPPSDDELSLLSAVRSAAAAVGESASKYLGAAERLVVVARESAESEKSRARANLERATAIARNKGAQQVAEFRSGAVEAANGLVHGLRSAAWADVSSLSPASALDVGDYVGIGTLTLEGREIGVVHEDSSIPAVVPLLDRGNVIVRSDALDERLVNALNLLTLRELVCTGPGQLAIESFDPSLRATVAPFVALRSAAEELLPLSRSTEEELDDLLRDLTTDVKRIRELYRGGRTSLGEYRSSTGQPIEGYQLVIVRDFPRDWSNRALKQLQTLLESGPSCGISFLIHHDPAQPPLGDADPKWIYDHGVAIDLLAPDGVPRLSIAPRFRLDIEAAPELGDMEAIVRGVARSAAAAAAPRISFADLHSAIPVWSRSSADGITAVIGRAGHEPTSITLGDETSQRHNVLVSGAVGQGKSNLLMAMVHSLAWQYSPAELRMYLIDLKEGLTLHPLAPHPPDQPEFLPQAAVLGLESDRSFAVAVLQDLVAEFERRASVIKASGDNISRYRKANPGSAMPRLLVVIDEFHKLFQGDDASASVAIDCIEQLAREGRAYGIHLVLASQTLSGITALLAKQDGIFSQFPIRLALKNSSSESRVVLDQANTEASRLRFRGEVIINQDFGALEANRRAVVADANLGEMAALRRELWERDRAAEQPRVFNGSKPADLIDAIGDLRALRVRVQRGSDERLAIVGREISTTAPSTGVALSSSAGSHLAVLGAGSPQRSRRTGIQSDPTGPMDPPNLALGALEAAAVSIAVQHPKCDAEFVFVDALDRSSRDAANLEGVVTLLEHLGQSVLVVKNEGIAEYFLGLEQSIPERTGTDSALYVVGLGLDRANLMQQTGFAKPVDGLRLLLRSGPTTNAHLLGWWASMASFNECLGFEAQGSIGGLLALGVQQSELSGLLGPFVTWTFSANRGLLHQGGGSEPATVVPMQPISRETLHILTNVEWD